MYPILQQYEQYLRESKASDNTRSAYLLDVGQFLEAVDFGGDVDSITESVLETYRLQIETATLAPATRNRKLSSVNSFLRWLRKTELLRHNMQVTGTGKMHTPSRAFPELPTGPEVDALFASYNLDNPWELRDRAMVELIYATGLQVNQILTLTLEQVQFNRRQIIMHSGENIRRLPVYRQAIKILEKYCAEVRIPTLESIGKHTDVLFMNSKGDALTRQGFAKRMRQAVKKAGLNSNITAKTLRQTMAVHLLQNGASLQSVQELVGHRSAQSTQFYQLAMQNAAQTTYRNRHPKSRSKK